MWYEYKFLEDEWTEFMHAKSWEKNNVNSFRKMLKITASIFMKNLQKLVKIYTD